MSEVNLLPITQEELRLMFIDKLEKGRVTDPEWKRFGYVTFNKDLEREEVIVAALKPNTDQRGLDANMVHVLVAYVDMTSKDLTKYLTHFVLAHDLTNDVLAVTPLLVDKIGSKSDTSRYASEAVINKSIKAIYDYLVDHQHVLVTTH